jgi:2-polyprenyl-3-methyl-5-hydroxy-6-metoxy-1,4-benzoquinol methylase
MNKKLDFRSWNRDKWEDKNQAMYKTYAENRWPWFNDGLDPDIEEFMSKVVRESLEILDLGTCSGSQAIELARKGHRVTGTDISPTALEQARQAASREPGLALNFLLDDITASRLAEHQFDMVLDRGCYHSICAFQHEEYVAGVRRVMKRGGVLLLKTMSSDETRFIAHDNIGGKLVQMPYHFSREELRGMLAPHFEVLQMSDSFFYSKVVEPPARARLVVLRDRG